MGAALGLACVMLAMSPIYLFGLLCLPVSIVMMTLSRRCFPVPKGKRLAFVRIKPASGSTPKATIVFVHGYPNDYRLFADKHAPYFANQNFQCILVALPKYFAEDRPPLPALERENVPPPRRYGYSLSDVGDFLNNTLVAIKEENPTLPVVLVAHDWGALIAYGMLRAHRDSPIAGLVTLDVGIPSKLSAYFLMFCFIYQGLANVTWVSPWPISSFFARFETKLMGTTPEPGYDPAQMTYLYRELWRTLFLGGNFEVRLPPKGTKFLFVYGNGPNRPAWQMFSDDKWCKKVASTSENSKAVAMPGSHWFFMGKNADSFNALLLEWMQGASILSAS